MVLHVIDALAELTVERVVVVVGHRRDRGHQDRPGRGPGRAAIEFVEQPDPRGTGDAVAVALTGFPAAYDADLDEADLVVLPGDTPLVRPATLARLVKSHRVGESAATMLTAELADPRGYSRDRPRQGREGGPHRRRGGRLGGRA